MSRTIHRLTDRKINSKEAKPAPGKRIMLCDGGHFATSVRFTSNSGHR